MAYKWAQNPVIVDDVVVPKLLLCFTVLNAQSNFWQPSIHNKQNILKKSYQELQLIKNSFFW